MAFTRFTASSLTTGVAKYIDADAGRTPIPSVPTIGTATDGGTGSTVNVAFTPGYYAGTYYTATSSPGSITATSNTSPITVSGLTAGTAYTFTVKATNGTGTSAASAASNSVTPVVPTSFESIATFTGNGTTGTYTFSSIPSTYKSLQIRVLTLSGGASGINLRMNGDTGSNYARHSLRGNGATASASNDVPDTSILLHKAFAKGTDTTYPAVCIADVIDYASTSKNKTLRGISGIDTNSTSDQIELFSGLWINTSAVNSITIFLPSGNFNTGSSVALYGIKG